MSDSDMTTGASSALEPVSEHRAVKRRKIRGIGSGYVRRLIKLGYDPAKVRQEIVTAFRNRERVQEIAKRHQVHHRTVYHWAREDLGEEEYAQIIAANLSDHMRQLAPVGRASQKDDAEITKRRVESFKETIRVKHGSAVIDPDALRKVRKEAGFTQEQAAAYAGVSNPDLIRRYEKGLQIPAGNILLRLLLLYGAKPGDVAKYPD